MFGNPESRKNTNVENIEPSAKNVSLLRDDGATSEDYQTVDSHKLKKRRMNSEDITYRKYDAGHSRYTPGAAGNPSIEAMEIGTPHHVAIDFRVALPIFPI